MGYLGNGVIGSLQEILGLSNPALNEVIDRGNTLILLEGMDKMESVCDEFRLLYENVKGTMPYCVIEALSGAPFEVVFISFDDIREQEHILDDIDVVLNIGDAYTAYSGGENWIDEKVNTAVKKFVYEGGGFIGVGEPTAYQWEGRFFQLSGVLGVEKENGFDLNKDKYNWEEHAHFIIADGSGEVDFGEGKKSVFALDGTSVLVQREKEVQLAVNEFGGGRSVYISGLPYSFENSRLLYRAIIWSAGDENGLHKWFSTNYNVEVHAYVANGKYCVVNNTYEPQNTTVYRGDGTSYDVALDANEIIWYTC